FGLKKVFFTFIHIIFPVLRVSLFHLYRHKAGEDGITRILGSGSKNREVSVFYFQFVMVVYNTFKSFPLVISKVIYNHKQYRLFLFDFGNNKFFKKGMREYRFIIFFWVKPVFIVFLYEFTKLRVGFKFL